MTTNLVPSLETCKRMKELGWKKDTYLKHLIKDSVKAIGNVNLSFEEDRYVDWDEVTMAPLADEIDLPAYIPYDGEDYLLNIERQQDDMGWDIQYESANGLFGMMAQPSLAEAMSQMWIKLVEEGYLKV